MPACEHGLLVFQAVSKEAIEDQGNVPAVLSTEALLAVSMHLLDKTVTADCRPGAELTVAKM